MFGLFTPSYLYTLLTFFQSIYYNKLSKHSTYWWRYENTCNTQHGSKIWWQWCSITARTLFNGPYRAWSPPTPLIVFHVKMKTEPVSKMPLFFGIVKF